MTLRGSATAVAILLAWFAVQGCGASGGPGETDEAGVDSAGVDVSRTDAAETKGLPDSATRGNDTTADAKPDGTGAGPVYPPCACGSDDDCNACFALIGLCCYEDPTMGGQAGLIARNCDFNPSCKACCFECASRSCAEIKALGGCPAL